jgi:hypothetical protein
MFLSISQGPGGTIVASCHVSRKGHRWSDRQMLWCMIRHDQAVLDSERAVYEYLSDLLLHRAENYTPTSG